MSCTSPVILGPVYKDPDTELWYGLTWADRLADGVTISSSTWEVPAGLTEEAAQLASPIASIKLSGGTLGESYDVVNEVTYSTGEIDQQTLRFLITER